MKAPLLGILLISLLLNACNIVNPKETVPTYLQIDSVKLLPTDVNKHGTVNHKITDVWVYYNRNLLGAYELPAKVPILVEGKGDVAIAAGIWDNGISGTRAKYPFYTLDQFSLEANPTNTKKYTPTFYYRTSDTLATKYFVENFEQGNVFTKRSGDTSLVKTNTTNEIFEGDWSGKITLNDSAKTSEIITTQEYNIPPNKDAYLELNYKSDVDFDVNIEVYHLGTYYTLSVMSLRAKSNWNKVYLRLNGFAATYQYGKFKPVIKVTLPSGVTEAKLLIDNFKIIYFE